jgi:hypothetical protein
MHQWGVVRSLTGCLCVCVHVAVAVQADNHRYL